MASGRHEWERAVCEPGGAAEEFIERVRQLTASSRVHRGSAWWPSLDVFETEGGFTIVAELAGVERDALELHVQGGRLHLFGVRRPPTIAERQAVRQLEIDYGPFARTIMLDPGIDEERISAEYRNGLLVVRLPRRGGRRRVAIRAED